MDQTQILDKIREFLLSDTEEIIIDGGAGTGKSHLISKLPDLFNEYLKTVEMLGLPKKKTRLVITSTTNKSVAVLRQLGLKDVYTIYSYLELVVKYKRESGDTMITPAKGDINYSSYDVIVIDECSMISNELFKYLSKLRHKKIIYVGDCAQLTPVKEGVSKIYSKGLEVLPLDVFQRQENEYLRDTCVYLRNSVFNTNSIFRIPLNDRVKKLDNQQALEEFTRFNTENCQIACFTNKYTDKFNRLISSKIKHTGDYDFNEVYICNTPYSGCSYQYAGTHADVIFRAEEQVRVTEYDAKDIDTLEQVQGCWSKVQSLAGGEEYSVFLPNKEQLRAALRESYKKDYARYRKLKECINLRQSYACTIHKLQGSTYDNVFIVSQDIDNCFEADMRARLLYVAFSRAKHNVFFIGDSKYIRFTK